MRLFKNSPKHDGVAMITVLIIVALLSILVLAFLSTSQTDYQSSTSFADTQRAKLVAKGAVSHAVEILRNNIPEPVGIDQEIETAPARNWVINPGRLTIIDEQNEDYVDLHTGAADTDPADTVDPDVYSVDLNEPIPGKVDLNDDPVPTITYALDHKGVSDTGAPLPPMRVKWVNLLKDPSQPASKNNPIVARHAFWIDDESGKINFNTAMGKPDPEEDSFFADQLRLRMMPPLIDGGEDTIDTTFGAGTRKIGLGNSRSVNLDVLLDSPEELDKNELMAQSLLRGYARYPEAVMDFLDFADSAERTHWWNTNRYNLTSYSRSPEFNVFGRPRLMTTFTSLSLEGGPMYQHPFIWMDPGAPASSIDDRSTGILHLNSLLGILGKSYRKIDVKGPGNENQGQNGESVDLDTEETPKSARTVVNHVQAEMLMSYFHREFPGYSGTFVDKYGEEECAQIALNILAMAHFGTNPVAYGLTGKGGFPEQLAAFLGKNDFFPNSSQGIIPDPVDNTKSFLLMPERNYWWYQPGVGFLENPPINLGSDPESVTAKPMLPVQAGPFITEIKAIVRPETVRGKQNAARRKQRLLSIQLVVEYYLPSMLGELHLHNFPFLMDYVTVTANGQELINLGTDESERDWRSTELSKLKIHSGLRSKGNPRPGQVVSPSTEESPDRNRQKLTGQKYYFTTNPKSLSPNKLGNVKKFNYLEFVDLSIALRAGVGMHLTYGDEKRRLYWYNNLPLQMIPLGVTQEDVLEGDLEVDMLSTAGTNQYSISWQISDPRLSSHKDSWEVDTEDDLTAGTIGQRNENEPEENSSEKSKFRSIQRGYDTIEGYKLGRGDEMESDSRVSSKGFWSFIHTGVQNGIPWRTLALNEDTSSSVPGPPDWLLMNLMGATQPIQHDQRQINATLPDEFSTVSYMHSTTGAINLNTRTFPDDSPYFQAPARTKPLEAVFKYLRSDTDIEAVLSGIESHQKTEMFRYVGDLAQVNGYDVGTTEWERETLLRNMINCLTTNSNTFGVWGAGQVVKKKRGNENWGEFEDGDSVRGEKRFFAIVERYIWPGKDGVPGNAHVNAAGELDRLAEQVIEADRLLDDDSIRELLFQLPGSAPYYKGGAHRLRPDEKGTFPEFDGPQKVVMNHFEAAALGKVSWRRSALEDAYNPPQAVTKYRVVYFKYLDD